MKIFVIRHSQTQWNKEWKLQWHLDSPLTDFWIETAQKLAGNLAWKNITKIISSDLWRCVQTAEIVWKKLNINNFEKDKLLRERSFWDYDWEYREKIVEELDLNDFELVAPNWESCRQVENRIMSFLGDFQEKFKLKKEDNVLIVTHHWILKNFLSIANNNDFNDESNKTTQQTIWEFNLEDNKLRFISKHEIEM